MSSTAQQRLLASSRIKAERDRHRRNEQRPTITDVETSFTAQFHAVIRAARASLPKGEASRTGPWVYQINPVANPAAALAALDRGATYLHWVSRATGTNVERDRHIRDWLVFCRLLGVSPHMVTQRDTATLHAYMSWKGLVYKGKRQSASAPPGLQHQTVMNEVATIRTYHREVVGVDLHRLAPLAQQLGKGIKRIATASRPTLRISAANMIEMELLDAADGNLDAADYYFVHSVARRLGFEAMLRISEFAVSLTAKHALLHQDVVFDFDEAGNPTRCSWLLRHAKNRQYSGIVRDIMAAPDNPHDFVGLMWRMSKMNARFLANHPRADRSTLPFINVRGKPLTKVQVGTHLHKRLSQCESVGAAFLALHKTGTHCLRRGGARMWLNILPGGEAYLRWLGGWRPSARLVYSEVAVGFKQRAAAIRAEHMRTALHHLSP